MAFTTILLILFIIPIGYATFIQSEFSEEVARQAIYNTVWFEILLVLLSVNLIGSLIKYKTWHTGKWSMILFHIAFVVIIIGAGVTRYFSFEGYMNIREGKSSNYITTEKHLVRISDSNNNFLAIEINEDEINQHPKSYSNMLIDMPLTITFQEYVKSAAKLIKRDPNGVNTIWLAVADSTFSYSSLHLQPGETKKYGKITYSFKDNPEADIIFFVKNDSLYFRSKNNLFASSIQTMKHVRIKSDSNCICSDTSVYQIGWNSFILKEFLPKGKIQIVSMVGHEGNYPLDALIMNVNYGNETKIINIFGSPDYLTQPEEVKIGNEILSISYGAEIIKLPFDIHLNDFIIDRYANSMSPSSFKSNVVLIDSAANINQPFSIYMNHILKYKGFRFFQSSYDRDEKGTILSVNYDPIGTLITYLGYLLMTIGMFFALFSRKSYFRELLKKGTKATMIIVAFLFISQSAFSQTSINELPKVDVNHAKKFEQLLIADPNGRIKPMGTLASEILRKVSRKNSLDGNTPSQVVLSILIHQANWENIPLILVKNQEIKDKYGFKSDYLSIGDIIIMKDGISKYILSDDVQEISQKAPNQRSKYDKELLKLDERVNIVDMVISGGIFHVFPIKGDKDNKWISVKDLENKMSSITNQEELYKMYIDYYKGLLIGTKTGNWKEANYKLDIILKYQQEAGGSGIPSEAKIHAELIYNKINYFSYASKLYLIFGLILLIVLFIKVLKSNVKIDFFINFSKIAIITLFIGHTGTLAVRWYISGHAPWSNGYETTLFIAWATMIAGIAFAKKSPISLSLTSLLTAIFILISSLSWMDPEITNLVPVLKSYWLIIHVAVITSSYGFFAMIFLMGLVNIILISISKDSTQMNITNVIENLSNIISMAMIIGLYLLTIGTFLGAVWANESWGRYWSWDPKETWALITVVVYSIALHLRHIPGMKNYYVVSIAGLLSFGSVLMTYFGVNYFLTGMHSYAAGDAFTIPLYAKVIVLVLIGITIFAGVKFYNNPLKWRNNDQS